MPPKQAAVAVSGRSNRRIIVGLGCRDDPSTAAPPKAPEPPQHGTWRGEISEDHVQPLAALDVADDASPPAVAHAERPAELPLQRPAPFAELGKLAAQILEARAGALGPAEERVEIAAGHRDLGALDGEPQVAPVLRPAIAHVRLIDIRTADDCDPIVDDHQLLVIAQEVTTAVARVEHAFFPADLIQGAKKLG